MFHRIVMMGAVAVCVSLSAAACVGVEADDADEDESLGSSDFALQPAPGIYTSASAVSGFPLGKCGYSGTTAQRNSDMNGHNAPYTMEWSDDSCLTVHASPEGCSLARDPAECEKWRGQMMKIIFPMDFSDEAAGGCLTSAQRTKLVSGSNMKSINIGNVYVTEASNPASPHLPVGTFRIFRHNGNYQYEMVAYGNRQPFMSAPFKAQFPQKQSLDGMKLCFDKTYASGLALPPGRTPLSCAHFTNEAKASASFGDLNTTSTAYGFYDPGAHNYCPVNFAAKPSP